MHCNCQATTDSFRAFNDALDCHNLYRTPGHTVSSGFLMFGCDPASQMRAGKWQLEPQALRCSESSGWAATTTAVIGNSAWWDDSSLACVGATGALIITHFPLVVGQASSYAAGTAFHKLPVGGGWGGGGGRILSSNSADTCKYAILWALPL